MVSPAPLFDANEMADAFGVSTAQLDEWTKMWWEQALEKAKRETLDTKKHREVAARAYKEHTESDNSMNLVCEIDGREAYWLFEKFGTWDFLKDLDFIKCYRKYRDQQFLPEPSKSAFE